MSRSWPSPSDPENVTPICMCLGSGQTTLKVGEAVVLGAYAGQDILAGGGSQVAATWWLPNDKIAVGNYNPIGTDESSHPDLWCGLVVPLAVCLWEQVRFVRVRFRRDLYCDGGGGQRDGHCNFRRAGADDRYAGDRGKANVAGAKALFRDANGLGETVRPCQQCRSWQRPRPAHNDALKLEQCRRGQHFRASGSMRSFRRPRSRAPTRSRPRTAVGHGWYDGMYLPDGETEGRDGGFPYNPARSEGHPLQESSLRSPRIRLTGMGAFDPTSVVYAGGGTSSYKINATTYLMCQAMSGGVATGGWMQVAEITWSYIVTATWPAGGAPRIRSQITVSGQQAVTGTAYAFSDYSFANTQGLPQWAAQIQGGRRLDDEQAVPLPHHVRALASNGYVRPPLPLVPADA